MPGIYRFASTLVLFTLGRVGVSVFRKSNERLARSTMRAGLLNMMRERISIFGRLLIQVAVFALGM